MLLLIAAGFGAGAMNAIAGGGTVLTFPALMLVGGDALRANTTSTVALIIGVVGSMVAYRRHVPRVASWLKTFIPVSLLGGVIGSILLTVTPPELFEWLVPFLLLFATVLFMSHGFFRRHAQHSAGVHAHPGGAWLAGAILFQFGVSIYGGYFGAGIGILMLASLGMLGLGDIHEMNTVKTVLGGFINLVAAGYFVWRGLVDWPQAGSVAVGSLAGYYAGAAFAQTIPQASVRHIASGIGLLLSALFFWRQLF